MLLVLRVERRLVYVDQVCFDIGHHLGCLIGWEMLDCMTVIPV
jgi:hypothetical protein